MTTFRLQNKDKVALANGKDWFNSSEYHNNAINGINDPNGGMGNEPTSIPSPFARLDLMRTAIRFVNDMGHNGNTVYHKIVSHMWDIGEIFFNLDIYNNQFAVREWDKVNDLNQLLNSPAQGHKQLGRSLELYLSQDAKVFNFGRLNKLYFLEYNSEIIGGISPSTLFYYAETNLNNIQIVFPNNNKAFDSNNLFSLHKRDVNFIKYIYSLRSYITIPNFGTLFADLNEYLNIEFNNMTDINLRNEINSLLPTYYLNGHNNSNSIFFLDYPVCQSKPLNIGTISSDFEIASTKYRGTIKPLVLINGHSGKSSKTGLPMKYYTANYDTNIDVPNNDNAQIENRLLPGLIYINHPYLCIGDFLEEVLVRTIFPINETAFFDGNHDKGIAPENQNKGFLLPIKQTFFEYFDVKDLMGTVCGKKMFEMKTYQAATTEVTLRIPVKNNEYIEYTKEYRKTDSIVEIPFSLSLYPFLKLEDTKRNNYRIGLFDASLGNNCMLDENSLKFYSNEGVVEINHKRKRTSKEVTSVISSTYYSIDKKEFDYIELSFNDKQKALLIPRFDKVEKNNGFKSYKFAVDFGTTNTHIEYTESSTNQIVPFSIKQDKQLAFFHKISEKNNSDAMSFIEWICLQEVMPEEISNDNFGFPIRTAISSTNGLDINKTTETLVDLNIPFHYERRMFQSGRSEHITEYKHNLKWGNISEKYIQHYIENILLLIKNKVILNNGDLDSTELVWFYPTSMLPYQRLLFEKTWNDAFKRFISEKNVPISITESVAPFYYLQMHEGVTAVNRPLLSIDIGGGTTDVVVYESNEPTLITSFRYASNSIFGDGFNKSSSENGFIISYKDKIRERLKNDNKSEIEEIVFRANNLASSDLITSFFKIEENILLNPNRSVSFSDILTHDNRMKPVFLLFYTSIIYHVAKLLKQKNISCPAYITFTGNGSKLLKIIAPSGDMNILSNITNVIFKNVGYDSEIKQIKNYESPKELTAKGGVLFLQSKPKINDNINEILLTSDIILNKDKKLNYSEINPEMLNVVKDDYIQFISMFKSINEVVNFNQNFGFSIEKFEDLEAILTSEVEEHIALGIERKILELKGKPNNPIEETLFFYPFIGGLNLLASKIAKESEL